MLKSEVIEALLYDCEIWDLLAAGPPSSSQDPSPRAAALHRSSSKTDLLQSAAEKEVREHRDDDVFTYSRHRQPGAHAREAPAQDDAVR